MSSQQEINTNVQNAPLNQRWFNWKSFIIGAVTMFTLVGVTAGVFANRVRNGRWIAHKIAKQLDLSTDQKARLQIIWREAHSDKAQHKANVKKFQAKLKAVLSQDKPSKAELDGLVNDFFDYAKRQTLSKTAFFLRAHDVLSPQQRKKIRSTMEKFHKRMQKRRERMHRKHGNVPPFLK